MKGIETERKFPIINKINGDKELLLVGTTYSDDSNRVKNEINIDLLISDPGSIDFQKLLCGAWDWDVNMYSGRGTANLNWMLVQLFDVMVWAKSIGFNIITFTGSDERRQKVFSKILKRQLKKYGAEDIVSERKYYDDDDEIEVIITIPSWNRITIMKVIRAVRKFNKVKAS